MSQRALAAATNPGNRSGSVSASYISRIERGERFPSLYLVRAFADVFNVSPEWLERGDVNG